MVLDIVHTGPASWELVGYGIYLPGGAPPDVVSAHNVRDAKKNGAAAQRPLDVKNAGRNSRLDVAALPPQVPQHWSLGVLERDGLPGAWPLIAALQLRPALLPHLTKTEREDEQKANRANDGV